MDCYRTEKGVPDEFRFDEKYGLVPCHITSKTKNEIKVLIGDRKKGFLFPNPDDETKHLTTNAVLYKFGNIQTVDVPLTGHTCRKSLASYMFHKRGLSDIEIAYRIQDTTGIVRRHYVKPVPRPYVIE